MSLGATLVLGVIAAYAAAGLVTALAFVCVGVERVLPQSATVSIPARILLIPGVVALWPYVVARWVQSAGRS
jgi:hypothetical protein